MSNRLRAAFLATLALFAIMAALFGACSSNDGKSGDSGANAAFSGGSGTDEQFVKGVCVAGSHFLDAITKGFDKTPSGSASEDDLGKFFESFFANLTPAFEGLAKDFKALKPPPDLVQWHADSVKQMDAAVKALKAGNFEDPALQDLGNEAIPPLPQGVQDRLQKVADNTKECKDLEKSADSSGGSGSIFGGLMGGESSPTPTKK